MSAQTQSYFEKQYTDGFFDVSPEHGFLPIHAPLTKLPETYAELQKLMEDLPIHLVYEKTPGILAKANEIEVRVAALPDYTEQARAETDTFIVQALFRAYAFLASSYTLELSYQHYLKTGDYGKARTTLPVNVARPLVIVAEKLDVYPWLDYHYAYSTGNYMKKDPAGDLHWKNLDMSCRFSGTPDETGFIMLHVYINELTPHLMDSIMNIGRGKDLVKNLEKAGQSLTQMNSRRKEMWQASRHERYNDFRIFIMGIQGNEDIFGEGLVYEGCFDNKPMKYRGQTGAQDSIIPMCDIFSGIVDYYPTNKLTEYLMDLRTYRPKCIQEFFIDLRQHYVEHGLFQTLTKAELWDGLVYLLKIVDEVYLFRNGHWQFVQKYIMANTKYAKATGGTPITTWLINQIEAVLEYERVIIATLAPHEHDISANCIALYTDLRDAISRKRRMLEEQVVLLKDSDINVNLVYQTNLSYGLEDKPSV